VLSIVKKRNANAERQIKIKIMEYRIVYEKIPEQFYIQRLVKYKSWFGLGKEKEKWVYVKNWYEGSYYPPYSPDYYDKHSFRTLKYAKEHLKELIKKDKLNYLEVVYER